MEHAKMIGQPTIDYYNNAFNNEKGDCYNIRQMAEATKIFNPLFLTGKSDAEIFTLLHPLADKLKYFGHTHFTQDFIDMLKKEFPKIIQEASKDDNLDVITPSTKFKTRMEK